MVNTKASIIHTIAWLLLLVNLISAAEFERFEVEIGPGKRDGQAKLVVRPSFESKTTIADFQTRQVGVNKMNRVRVAVQWLRNSNNETDAKYDGVVLQLRVPVFGTTEDPALEKVLVAKDFKKYRAEGGKLNIDEYIDLILRDDDLTVTTFAGSIAYVIKETKIVTGDFVNAVLSFQAPYMDQIGESKVWYRWTFFNNETKCSEPGLQSTCLAESPIDGDIEPFLYTTYFQWSDFYDLNDLYTFLYLMFGISVFGPFGLTANFAMSFIMQAYLLFKGVYQYELASQYRNFPQYETEIMNLLALSLAYINITCSLFVLYTAIPFVGPVLNFVVIQFMPVEIQRLRIPLRFTIEKLS